MATNERRKALIRKEECKKIIAFASIKNLKTSSRKARVLADLIRGQLVKKAYNDLLFQKRFAAEPIRKLLKSASANAAVRGYSEDDLKVCIQVHKAKILKRSMPRSQGRATPIRKQYTHIEVYLKKEENKKKWVKK